MPTPPVLTGAALSAMLVLSQARAQIEREPRPLPKMHLRPDVRSIFDFRYGDFELLDYDPHPHISAPVAV